MSAHSDLMALYQEWRHLSEVEGQAIRSATWPDVAHCQEAKYQLQSRILSARELFQVELDAKGLGAQEYDRHFRGILAELILLEERNGKWLASQRQKAQEQLQDLDRTSRNLRQVHQAYSRPPQMAWQSYS